MQMSFEHLARPKHKEAFKKQNDGSMPKRTGANLKEAPRAKVEKFEQQNSIGL